MTAPKGDTIDTSALTWRPIGTIRTPFVVQAGTPIQAALAQGAEGTIELLPEYVEGLADLEGFSHIVLVYAFHRCQGYSLRVKPYLDDTERGLFATRAPRRPNAIGLSTVRLCAVEGRILKIADVDMLDGTPLLDIKPFVPDFEHRQGVRTGWYAGQVADAAVVVADTRFEGGASRDPQGAR
jgi:tRNA-Thr(GGU) m(6)t(6)A37 methyltransferase TsaA